MNGTSLMNEYDHKPQLTLRNIVPALLCGILISIACTSCSSSDNDQRTDTSTESVESNAQETTLQIWTAAGNGDIERVRSLLASGANVDARDPDYGMTPLMWAAARGHRDVVSELLDRGADIDALSASEQNSALMLAAHGGHVFVVRTLLRRGADARLRNSRDATALHHAATSGSLEIIRQLLDAGLDPNARESDGTTVFMYAAARVDGEPLINELIGSGAEVSAVNDAGETALHFAAENGLNGNLTLLLKHGLAPLIDVQDHVRGETALHRALFNGHHDAVVALLSAGADVGVQTTGGDSAFHYAAEGPNPADTMRVLIDESQGGDVNQRNNKGETALILAAQNRLKNDVLAVLLDAGANPNLRTRSGLLALEAAVDDSNLNAVELLIAHGAKTDVRDSHGVLISDRISQMRKLRDDA